MDTSFALCNHPAIGIFVKHFWQTEGSPTYRVENILPKGEIELIFSFGDTVRFERAGFGTGITSRCFVNGISNIPIRLFIPNHQSFFGVVLHAAAAKKLLYAPSGIFLNSITDLELVDGNYQSLWHQLAECKTFKDRIRETEKWFFSRLSVIHEQEKVLAGFLTSSNQVATVSGLAADVCYSTRQLHRKVKELFGMSTEVLLRYKRYHQALHQLHGSNETLTRIAHECGYYDQAHFNREFKDYTSLTPGAYRHQKSHLPGHLYQ